MLETLQAWLLLLAIGFHLFVKFCSFSTLNSV
jgi:hypothetical protein